MNELIVKQTLDSREVAEMMGIEHPDITAALRTGYPLTYRYDDEDDLEEYWEDEDYGTEINEYERHE